MAEYWMGQYRYDRENEMLVLEPVRKMTDEEAREMRKKRTAAGLAEPTTDAIIFFQE